MKADFDTRPETSYDDDIIRRYHFPNRYLAEARKSVGDWIVYREPQRGGGRRGYIGVAHVTHIEMDPTDTTSSYALVSNFLPFDTVVPLRREKGYYETWLNDVSDRSRIGFRLQGKSIRTIPDSEFNAITLAGFVKTLDPEKSHVARDDASQGDETVRALIRAPKEEQERRIVQMLVNRPLRDAAFRTDTCSPGDKSGVVPGLSPTVVAALRRKTKLTTNRRSSEVKPSQTRCSEIEPTVYASVDDAEGTIGTAQYLEGAPETSTFHLDRADSDGAAKLESPAEHAVHHNKPPAIGGALSGKPSPALDSFEHHWPLKHCSTRFEHIPCLHAQETRVAIDRPATLPARSIQARGTPQPESAADGRRGDQGSGADTGPAKRQTPINPAADHIHRVHIAAGNTDGGA